MRSVQYKKNPSPPQKKKAETVERELTFLRARRQRLEKSLNYDRNVVLL